MRLFIFIIIINLISCTDIINEDMRLLQSSLSKESSSSIGYFEDMFLKNQNRIESRVRIVSGVLEILEVYTDKVLRTTYETDTRGSDGEYILFGELYLHERDDGHANGYGALVHAITNETVVPFAFIITGHEWAPHHGYKTMWSFDGNIPPINIDGTDYVLYTDTLAWQTFNKITITQDNFSIKTVGAFPGTPDRVTDGIMEYHTVLTITPQQMIQDVSFKVTQEEEYNIGYTPMWSVTDEAPYILVQNGNKVVVQEGQNETIHFDDDVYQFGYNTDSDYGCAAITDNSNAYWTLGTPAPRRFVCTGSGTKRKLYFVMMANHTPSLNDTYSTATKYIWGKSNYFQTIYNSAPTENL